jgi:hypothetical protein
MASWVDSHPAVYPALEVVHVVGIALLVGNLALLEWRVWGGGRELPLAPLARLTLTLALGGFGLAATSGVAMFATQAADLMANRAFLLKMGLLTLAGANAGLFHARQGLAKVDRTARWQTALSLGLWVGVIICGRWIGYR